MGDEMTNEKTTKARTCKARTANGAPCKMKPTVTGYCFNHDPGRAADRAQARKRGGEARHTPHAGDADAVNRSPRTIEESYSILDYALVETLAMDNGIQRNRLLVSIAAAYVDARKVGELETQLMELMRILGNREQVK
jgi:hypothetical protein